MFDLLKDHKFVRISFSCSGPLDESSLPLWIRVNNINRPLVTGNRPQEKRMLAYTAKNGALPSGLFDFIVGKNNFRLQRVTARDKSNSKYGQYSVLNFEFTRDAPQDEHLEQEASDALRYMLVHNWQEVKMYMMRNRVNKKSISISFSKMISVSEHTTYREADAWGIKLVCV